MNDNNHNSSNNLSNLITDLKKKDSNYSNLCKRMKYVYWAISIMYVAIIAIELIEQQPVTDILSPICFLAGMLSFAWLFNKYQNEYKSVDYSLPTLLMLKKALNRYQPFTLRTVWVIPGVLLVGAGLSLNSPSVIGALKTQLYFWGLMLVSTFIGWVVWYYKYKPLRDHTQALISEIESNKS